MAKNNSGAYVHAHTDSGTVVVAPGEDFPKGYDADASLTGDAADDELEPVPGPSQTVNDKSAEEVESGFRAMKVADLRNTLDAAGVEYAEGDRKDALIEKAQAAGLEPEGSEA